MFSVQPGTNLLAKCRTVSSHTYSPVRAHVLCAASSAHYTPLVTSHSARYRTFRSKGSSLPLFAQSRSISSIRRMADGEVPCKASAESEQSDTTCPIVQYVVLRRDLGEALDWPLGSVVAQGCHAATAAMWLSRDDPVTQEYTSPENLDHMHKVVLEVKGEPQLKTLAAKLEEAGIAHKLWIEQPENYPTCLATKPYRKDDVAQHFKKCQLSKSKISR